MTNEKKKDSENVSGGLKPKSYGVEFTNERGIIEEYKFATKEEADNYFEARYRNGYESTLKNHYFHGPTHAYTTKFGVSIILPTK